MMLSTSQLIGISTPCIGIGMESLFAPWVLVPMHDVGIIIRL